MEADDQRAAVLARHHALLQAEHDQQAAAVESDVAAYAFERRRVLAGRREDVDRIAAELAPLKANLEAAKATREVWFNLASDQPLSATPGGM